MHERVQQILGYEFQNVSLLNEALTHASIAGHRLESNERMEFLGDAILGVVVSDYLFRNYPTYLEGDLTKIKSAVVSRKSGARVSQALELQTMLSLGKGMAGREVLPSSIAAAVFESIIAAIYLDGGMEPARAFILRHMTPIIQETAASAHQQNFKSMLQHHAQKSLPCNPIYVVLDEKGPDHSKCFEVCVEVDGRRFESAWAASKKEAEQKAAQLALRDLGVLWDQESDEPSDEAAAEESATEEGA
ncbi:MAG: ribonuclease III [Verrucomicrobiae bacterium]|nr:ribonuclease III [Verrucomicrobiae bacterium]